MVAATKKRGRPRKFSDDGFERAELCAVDTSSKRQIGNIRYRQRALRVLRNDGRFIWLFGMGKTAKWGKSKQAETWRRGLLSELGRIEDDEILRAIALQICELKPKTKDGIAMIRQARLGREQAGGAAALTDEIIRAVSSYLCRYPATTSNQVRGALTIVLRMVEQSVESEVDYCEVHGN